MAPLARAGSRPGFASALARPASALPSSSSPSRFVVALICALSPLAGGSARAGVAGTPRNFVMEIFSFDPIGDAYDQEFTDYVDECVKKGFDTIRIDIPWDVVEPVPGIHDWTRFDQQLDYVVASGFQVMLIVNVRDKPLWLLDPDHPLDGTDSYLMRFSDGTVFHGGPDIKIGGQPITRFGCLTFNDDSVRALIADFHEAVVEHYQSRWPSGTVLNYMTCADPTMETEYSCAGYLDFSRYAKAEYRTWLQQRYGTIGALNAAWGTKYTSFSQVNPYFNTKAPKPDRDPRWLDWVRFRSFSLKRFIDEMADRVHAADPDAEYGVQFGGGLWHTPWIRNLFELETLVENCDWVVNYGRQDFPNQFDADVNRGILPDKKLIAELDGPHFGFTDTQNLNCGKAAFNRGYVAVELANWAYQGLDTLRDPQWTFLATLASMGTGKVPKITPVGTIDANVSDLYAWHDTTTWRDAIYAQWKTLTSNGAKIADVKYHDDLTR